MFSKINSCFISSPLSQVESATRNFPSHLYLSLIISSSTPHALKLSLITFIFFYIRLSLPYFPFTCISPIILTIFSLFLLSICSHCFNLFFFIFLTTYVTIKLFLINSFLMIYNLVISHIHINVFISAIFILSKNQ